MTGVVDLAYDNLFVHARGSAVYLLQGKRDHASIVIVMMFAPFPVCVLFCFLTVLVLDVFSMGFVLPLGVVRCLFRPIGPDVHAPVCCTTRTEERNHQH